MHHIHVGHTAASLRRRRFLTSNCFGWVWGDAIQKWGISIGLLLISSLTALFCWRYLLRSYRAS